MFVLFNAMFLAIVYVALIAFMLSKPGISGHDNSDDSGNDRGGDGGWDGIDDLPPLDLPPGVFVLPPDKDDPSRIRKLEEDYAI
ncbi:MAG: hypothetical protein AAGI07_01935 [Bacteroidota bacterium]